MIGRLKYISSIFLSFLLAEFAYAATFASVVGKVAGILNSTIYLLVGLAAVFLAYGIFRYINAGDDATRLTEARNLIIWGVVVLFVMVSIWGILNMLMLTIFGTSSIVEPSISTTLYPNQ